MLAADPAGFRRREGDVEQTAAGMPIRTAFVKAASAADAEAAPAAGRDHAPENAVERLFQPRIVGAQNRVGRQRALPCFGQVIAQAAPVGGVAHGHHEPLAGQNAQGLGHGPPRRIKVIGHRRGATGKGVGLRKIVQRRGLRRVQAGAAPRRGMQAGQPVEKQVEAGRRGHGEKLLAIS